MFPNKSRSIQEVSVGFELNKIYLFSERTLFINGNVEGNEVIKIPVKFINELF